MTKLKIKRESQAVLSGNNEWETEWGSTLHLAAASRPSIQSDTAQAVHRAVDVMSPASNLRQQGVGMSSKLSVHPEQSRAIRCPV